MYYFLSPSPVPSPHTILRIRCSTDHGCVGKLYHNLSDSCRCSCANGLMQQTLVYSGTSSVQQLSPNHSHQGCFVCASTELKSSHTSLDRSWAGGSLLLSFAHHLCCFEIILQARLWHQPLEGQLSSLTPALGSFPTQAGKTMLGAILAFAGQHHFDLGREDEKDLALWSFRHCNQL